MAGSSPRLSGLAEQAWDGQLSWGSRRGWLAVEQGIEAASLHQVDAHEASEGERAGDGFLRGLRQAQQEEGDERDGDLGAYGVVRGAQEAGDLKGLLDPAKEQLDRPAALVEKGDLGGRGVEIVGQDAQYLAGVGGDPHLAHRVLHRVGAARALAL